MPRRGRSADRQRRHVDVGGLEQCFQGHDADIGKKMSLLLRIYHSQFVEPRLQEIEAHVLELEMPWYRKLLRHLKPKEQPMSYEISSPCPCDPARPHIMGEPGCKYELKDMPK
jgi:hypothetical protein